MFYAKNIVQQLQYFTKIRRIGINVKNSLSPCIGGLQKWVISSCSYCCYVILLCRTRMRTLISGCNRESLFPHRWIFYIYNSFYTFSKYYSSTVNTGIYFSEYRTSSITGMGPLPCWVTYAVEQPEMLLIHKSTKAM